MIAYADFYSSHIRNPKLRGSELNGHCPLHDDRHASFSANVDTGLWKCHAQCGGGNARQFAERLGVEPPGENSGDNSSVVNRYIYFDEQGNPLYRVCRTLPKGFFQERYDNGRWVGGQGCMDGVRRVPYRLPEILKASTVSVAEGEKDADRLWSLGIPATCNPGGAGKWRDEYSEWLRGKHVVILGDNDKPGQDHVRAIARSTLPKAASVKSPVLPGLGPVKEKHGEDVSYWLDKGHTKEELLDLAEKTSPLKEEDLGQSLGVGNPWEKAKDVAEFLAEEEKEFEGLAKDLLAPGAVSFIAAPRGLGKTQVSYALAVALAKGGVFREEQVRKVRVIILDRDNPPGYVRESLRSWGAGQVPSGYLKILTRDDAPGLKEKEAWETFPLEDYEVLIIDSVGSTTEGITEKEGKQTTEVIATVLDLARRKLAILLLGNTVKTAENYKGRGEWADRADIVYEVRDATDLKPTGKKPWWLELPEAGESAWGERAARRKNRTSYGLGFIPSKFRLGPEPEPFCLEIRLPEDKPWSLYDVTAELLNAGEDAISKAQKGKEDAQEKAAEVLAGVVTEGANAGNPIHKTKAEDYLQKEGDITRKEARQLIENKANVLWKIVPLPGQGKPFGLVPLDWEPPQNGPTAEKQDSGEADQKPHPEPPISAGQAQSGRQKYPARNPLPETGFQGTLFSLPEDFTSTDTRPTGEEKAPIWEKDL